jgi:DNA-binding transcriptional MerR regulator
VVAEIEKAASAFRTISEVAEELQVPQHVLRFWETRFSAVRPIKRGGNRRYYRPEDLHLLKVINHLLYTEGYTIRGVQKLLREQGPRQLISHHIGPNESDAAHHSSETKFEPRQETAAADTAPFVPVLQTKDDVITTTFDASKFEPASVSVLMDKASLLATLHKIRADVVKVLN